MTTYLCDVNVWLALALSAHAHQSQARRWLETVDVAASVIFCRSTQQSLLRLLTNAAVLAPYGNAPLNNREAWGAYEAFIRDDRVVMQVREPDGLEPQWRAYAERPTASPKLWMDAYLAAFAFAGGHMLVTTDGAFKQFAGLDVMVLSAT